MWKGQCGQILHLCCVLAQGMDTWVCQHQALVQLKHSACTERRAQCGCAHTCAQTLCCTPARYILQASQESAQTSCWLSRADTAPEEASLICQCKAFAKHKWVHTFTRPLLTQRWIAFITPILIFKRNWWAPGKESRMLSHIWELCFTQPLQQLAFAGRDERY